MITDDIKRLGIDVFMGAGNLLAHVLPYPLNFMALPIVCVFVLFSYHVTHRPSQW